MRVKEGDFLKKRALRFFENAKYLFQQEIYDLAAFNLHQAVELYIKHKLFLLLGDYPRTHSIKKLLREVGKASGKLEAIEKFVEEHIDRISNLENAYITSRYIPGEFIKKEVENMIKLVSDIFKLVDSL